MPSLLVRLDAAQRRSRPAAFAVAVWRKSADDQAGYLAALVSFYAFLAVFPLLLVLATVLGIVLSDHPGVQQSVMVSALADFPVIGTQLHANIHSLGGSGFALAVGLVGTAWGARGLSGSAQAACNAIWSIPPTRRPAFVRRQARGLALLAVIAVDVLATGALSGVAGIGDGHPPWQEWLGTAASTIVNAAMFTIGFRLAVAREVRVREFVRAACATAVVWQALLSLGTYLVAHELRHSEELYGVFGVVLGLLAWLHVQARITILLLEADCVRVRRLWPRTLDGPVLVDGDRRAYDAYAAAQQRRPGVRISVDYSASAVPPASAAVAQPPSAAASAPSAPSSSSSVPATPSPPSSAPQSRAGTRASTPAKSAAGARVPKARP